MDYSYGVAAKLEKAIEVLGTEDQWSRPYDRSGKSGGLVLLKEDIPTWVLPDLHGRHGFLQEFMDSSYEGQTMAERLGRGEGQVVCLGDGMHTESGTQLRWNQAYQEYSYLFKSAPRMEGEMADNFQTMALVMELKIKYPEVFHFLKGNHENIMGRSGGADRSICKFAAESRMVHDWVKLYLGAEFLGRFSDFEQSLPIVARGRNFLCAHARPLEPYKFSEVINHRENPDLVYGLTWTRESQAEPGVAKQMFGEFLGGDKSEAVMVVGHNPIPGLYDWDGAEQILHIHNPEKKVVCLFYPRREMDLESDIYELGS